MADSLERFVQLFEAAEQASPAMREHAERCRDYYDGKQWTPAEAEILRRRKQPVITINKIAPKVEYLQGVERQVRTQAKALPRTPQHASDSDAATYSIRYVCDDQFFDQKRSDVWGDTLIEGIGGVEVGVEEDGDGFKVVIKRYNYDRIFFDPHSRARDFSDAAYLGGVIWMDADDAKARFEGKEDVIDHALADTSDVDTYGDVPRVRWSDPKRKRVRVCLIYRRKPGAGWEYAWFTKSGFLKGPEDSPYYDYDERESCCPLIFTSAYVDRDGNRYGYVSRYLDPQDEYNKRRSRALHLMNQRQTFGNKQSGIEAKEVKKELSKADGHVDMQSGKWGEDFGIIPTTDMSTSNFRILELANQEINSVGPSETVSGKDERAGMSGRAILATQQGAQTEIGPLLDGLRSWQHRVYRAIWNRIRQYWDGETWVRVTDDEKNLKWVGLNAETDEQGQSLDQPQNVLSEMDVDIIIDDVPDTANVQAETFQMVTDAISRSGGDPKLMQMLIELMPGVPNKDKVREMLQGSPEEQEQQAQKQQLVEQMQMRQAQAELANTEADAQAKQMKAMEDRMDALHRQFETMMKARQSGADFEKAQAEAAGQAAQVGKTEAETEKLAAETAKTVIETLQAQGVIAAPQRDAVNSRYERQERINT